MENVTFIETGNSTSVEFEQIGHDGLKVGLKIIFKSWNLDKEKRLIFHYNLKSCFGVMRVQPTYEFMLYGKYNISYEDLNNMVESDVPELYMPLFLQIMYNFSDNNNKRIIKILNILDNNKLQEKTKIRRINKLDWQFYLGNSEEKILDCRESYKSGNQIMVECEELITLLK